MMRWITLASMVLLVGCTCNTSTKSSVVHDKYHGDLWTTTTTSGDHITITANYNVGIASWGYREDGSYGYLGKRSPPSAVLYITGRLKDQASIEEERVR